MPKRLVPVRGCVNVRLRVEANEASAGFELVKGWVNLDANSPAFVDSSGSMRQKKSKTQGRTNVFQLATPESSLLFEDLLKADDIHGILTGLPGRKPQNENFALERIDDTICCVLLKYSTLCVAPSAGLVMTRS
jgi:hypothetical protein